MWVYRIILAALFVLFVEAYLVGKYALSKVSFERSFDVFHAAYGQEIHLIEKISNNKILPIPFLKVESRIDEGLKFGKLTDLNVVQDTFHVSIFCLMPYTRIIRTHNVKCSKRGYFHLTSAFLSAKSITGNISADKDVQTDAKIYVFPKLLSLQELKLPSHSWQGDSVVRRWILEDPFVRAGVREYTYSDPIKNINWKASARTSSLQVNLYEPTAHHRLMILLNVDTKPVQWGSTNEIEKVEHGISVAATIFDLAYKKNIDVGFASNGLVKDVDKKYIQINPGTGIKQNIMLMETLSRLSIRRNISFSALLDKELERSPTNMDYLFVTAFVDDVMSNKIRQLRQKGNAVEILQI